VLEYHPSSDLALLQKAYVFSAKVHEGQERLSGEPYLVHPLDVAATLAELRLDDVTVAAGLLHDTVEDTLTTLEEIERLFGSEVAFLVEGLTKIAKMEFKSARVRQAENFRKMLLAMSKDIRILLIKLADRLHNMRTLEYLPEDARRRVAQETLDIYAPLAHRLGIDWMKRELEEHAFRVLRPEEAKDLERKLKVGRKARQRYIEEVKSILSTRLSEAEIEAEVTGRVKNLYSIQKKMERQSLALDELHDVIAFRVVTPGSRDSVYAALGIVHATWTPVQGHFKDYVALPKRNGYQSLHTVVIGPYGERMEVQVRTAEMHHTAEFGVASHWEYKEGRGGDRDDEQRFAWLRQLLDAQRDVEDPHEFLDAVKVDLFPEHVYVFTPKGEVQNLPRGATPVDFAYAIHSEVGDHCAGAQVNGKLVPLRHALEDGDTVEILTSTSQFPRKDWLGFVVSGKAQSRVRHSVRAAEKARSRELGRDILERELRRAGLSLSRLLERGELDGVAKSDGRGRSADDLFASVGYGRLAASAVVRRLKPEPASPPPPPRRMRRSTPSSKTGIRVSGMGDVLVRLAHCCNPLHGDEVIGFITRGRGVTVHLKDCRKVYELDPERRTDVGWDETVADPRSIKVRVVSADTPGLLASVTRSISAAGINIEGARITTTHGRGATQLFELTVSDVRSLNAVMQQLEKIKGVRSVERVRG
jgi:GTP pyrophosphokinase